jgi:hypothetical protein
LAVKIEISAIICEKRRSASVRISISVEIGSFSEE